MTPSDSERADTSSPGAEGSQAQPALARARTEFDELVKNVRVDLHRYCSRMIGSVIDGEDVVQDTLAKAFFMLPKVGPVAELRPWLFRIAHNKSVDFLRRYDRQFGEPLDEHPVAAEASDPLDEGEAAEVALSWYLKLTALQRSCVILMDVMDYSLAEISELLDMSIPAIKGALHRGRAALRAQAGAASTAARADLDPAEAKLLARYVEHFNGRDFDALRDLLADDARLEVVGRTSARGVQGVGSYYGNYERIQGWRVVLGAVDGRAALLGYDGDAVLPDGGVAPGAKPTFFILVQWQSGRIQSIRDFRYARHTMELAQLAFA